MPEKPQTDALGSTYIPVDSIVYPLTLRLYSLGYLDDAFIAMRPWTRRSLLHMLEKSADDITSDGNSEAVSILAYLQDYLVVETPGHNMTRGAVYGVESVYTRLMGVGGPVLRDSFHLGQTIYNDYGRPYATGFNNVTGFESVNEYGRFSLYVRGEYQHAPAYQGYSLALASSALLPRRDLPLRSAEQSAGHHPVWQHQQCGEYLPATGGLRLVSLVGPRDLVRQDR